ncbi:MAG TPA: carbohydrate ABC transporter permease [Firmicutes bacterium]|nr:carbohydrate ABC transporter permease [Bacillota bacterium]
MITGYPFVFMVQTSLKGQMDFFTQSIWALPVPCRVANYDEVLRTGFLRYFGNSAFVTVISVTLILLVASLASYVLSRLPFRFNRFILVAFMAGMMIPVHIMLIPVYVLTRRMGLYGSLLGLVGPYVAFNLPVAIFILTGFMKELPRELEDAAYIDGCSPAGTFWRVVLPLSSPALSTIAVYNFIILWNEFIFALVLLNDPKKWTLTMGLWNYQGQYGMNIPLIMAALSMSTLPLILFYILSQEKVVKGMVAGALKG